MRLISGAVLAAAMIPGIVLADQAINIDVIGVADGAMNVQYEYGMDSNSAVTVGYISALGITAISPGYKAAIGSRLGEGLYAQASADIWMGGGASATGFSGKVGYDIKLADNSSVSPYYGLMTLGGAMAIGYGVNVGFRF